MRPEDALDAARAAAAAARARGAYADELPGMVVRPSERVSVDQLVEWAVVEPDLAVVRSTRRYGAPITWAKRALVHVLRQYLGQLTAQQARFNLQVVGHLAELEERVARLERERDAWSSTRR